MSGLIEFLAGNSGPQVTELISPEAAQLVPPQDYAWYTRQPGEEGIYTTPPTLWDSLKYITPFSKQIEGQTPIRNTDTLMEAISWLTPFLMPKSPIKAGVESLQRGLTPIMKGAPHGELAGFSSIEELSRGGTSYAIDKYGKISHLGTGKTDLSPGMKAIINIGSTGEPKVFATTPGLSYKDALSKYGKKVKNTNILMSERGSFSTKSIEGAKPNAPKTSETLQNLYQDLYGLSAEQHPLRSRIEFDPIARVKFYHELQRRANMLPISPQKKEAIKLLNTVSDPKDVNAAYVLEDAAQWIHDGIGNQISKTAILLQSEFGAEDADKIIYKLWNNVLNPTEEGQIKLLKSERGSFSNKPIGRAATKEQKDLEKSKEIQDLIREEIGKYIQKSGKGGTITSRKGSGMISNKSDKLSTYLEEEPQPSEINKLGKLWKF